MDEILKRIRELIRDLKIIQVMQASSYEMKVAAFESELSLLKVEAELLKERGK